MISCERLDEVLKANGFLDKGRVYIPGCVESFAQGTYEDCLNNIARLAEYIVNNGSDDKNSTKALKGAVKTAGDILKLKSTDASGGKFTAAKKAVAEQKTACPQNISGLGISGYASECAKACAAGVAALLKDVEGVDEEEYDEINTKYLKKAVYKPYDKWQEDAKAHLAKAKKTIKEITDELAGVVDNSSTQALEDCKDVVARLVKWRGDAVSCYLMFEDSQLATLDGALDSAKKWAARNTGVSKRTPKAETGSLKSLERWKRDQMQKYTAASKKQ